MLAVTTSDIQPPAQPAARGLRGAAPTRDDDIDELPGGLDAGQPVAVVCGSGQRAAVGPSLIQHFGAEKVIHVVDGGVPTWKRMGWSTTTADDTTG